MIVKQFVEGFIANNNYLLIDEDSKEAALIDCTDYISELGAVLKEYDAKLKYILLKTLFRSSLPRSCPLLIFLEKAALLCIIEMVRIN